MRRFKLIVCMHIIALIIGVIILFVIPMEDKLCWNMGAVLLWTILLTAIAAGCSMPAKIKFKKTIKGYLIVFWALPVIALCCMGPYAIYFPGIVESWLFPPVKIIENDRYILREAPFDTRLRGYSLYCKRGLLEIYIGDTGNEEYEYGYWSVEPTPLPANTDFKSLVVSPEKNSIAVACADTILTYKIIK